MGCIHLVTCRACAQKSGYTSYNSVYVSTLVKTIEGKNSVSPALWCNFEIIILFPDPPVILELLGICRLASWSEIATECRTFPNFKFTTWWRNMARKKNGGHFLSISPLLKGIMLYLISIFVVEYLDCQYRWKFRTSIPNLMRYFGIKFVLLLCTWFVLWAIVEL